MSPARSPLPPAKSRIRGRTQGVAEAGQEDGTRVRGLCAPSGKVHVGGPGGLPGAPPLRPPPAGAGVREQSARPYLHGAARGRAAAAAAPPGAAGRAGDGGAAQSRRRRRRRRSRKVLLSSPCPSMQVSWAPARAAAWAPWGVRGRGCGMGRGTRLASSSSSFRPVSETGRRHRRSEKRAAGGARRRRRQWGAAASRRP